MHSYLQILLIQVKLGKENYKVGIEAVKDVGGIANLRFDGSHISFNCKIYHFILTCIHLGKLYFQL